MTASEIDLLSVARGLVVAPAGCGKTQLIADALVRHTERKPILILTHTNAGVGALRSRLDRAGIKPTAYRLSTIDGWAIRLITTFPQRAAHHPAIVSGAPPNYPAIREAAADLLKNQHINDVIAASYARLLVDEYQDCSIRQHAVVYYASFILPVCVMGDDMQAIFGLGNDPLADWHQHVCSHFAPAGALTTPWRWVNADAGVLGQWLLDARSKLLSGAPVDLRTLPTHVQWIQLDGSGDDHTRMLEACRTVPPDGQGSVLIVGESTNPGSQRRFASQTPGAVTVEAVDLRDLVSFAAGLDLSGADALLKIASFAEEMMTNIGAADLIRRVTTIMRGAERREASEAERAAIAFLGNRTYQQVGTLLVELNKQTGVRVYRPGVLQACLRALDMCHGLGGKTFYEAALYIREQNRFTGRPLPRRAVGSTLLLKGLEAEVVVILNADNLDARNLYVAMTRGSKRIVVCSRSPLLNLAR
ncbi:UvrD-helicase domain-containing protein [Bradyrhizobium sp. USDA 3364]